MTRYNPIRNMDYTVCRECGTASNMYPCPTCTEREMQAAQQKHVVMVQHADGEQEIAPEFGPRDAPDDYRIANRPGNPNWHGVKEWFDEAAQTVVLADADAERAATVAAAVQAIDAAAQKMMGEWNEYRAGLSDEDIALLEAMTAETSRADDYDSSTEGHW